MKNIFATAFMILVICFVAGRAQTSAPVPASQTEYASTADVDALINSAGKQRRPDDAFIMGVEQSYGITIGEYIGSTYDSERDLVFHEFAFVADVKGSAPGKTLSLAVLPQENPLLAFIEDQRYLLLYQKYSDRFLVEVYPLFGFEIVLNSQNEVLSAKECTSGKKLSFAGQDIDALSSMIAQHTDLETNGQSNGQPLRGDLRLSQAVKEATYVFKGKVSRFQGGAPGREIARVYITETLRGAPRDSLVIVVVPKGSVEKKAEYVFITEAETEKETSFVVLSREHCVIDASDAKKIDWVRRLLHWPSRSPGRFGPFFAGHGFRG